jgi:hypothetical protein
MVDERGLSEEQSLAAARNPTVVTLLPGVNTKRVFNKRVLKLSPDRPAARRSEPVSPPAIR